MATFISMRTGQFAYFDQQLGEPSWAGKRVCTPDYMQELFPNGKILEPVRPERHHCLVIDKTSYAG